MSTLNLVPPEIQRETQAENRQRLWWHIIITLFIFAFLADGVLTATWLMLDRHATTITTELRQLQDEQRQNTATDITATTNELNATIKTVSTLLPTSPAWGSNIATVLKLLPTGISLTEVSVDATGAVHLVGTCDTRQTFINLDAALRNAKTLTNITTKSKASKRTDVPFDYTATLNITKS
jgi:Tfp pilus assembly protein PilN